MIGNVMRDCRNYFEGDSQTAEWHVDGQTIAMAGSTTFQPRSQYVAIIGSTFHDGVWRVTEGVLQGADQLPDEKFTGTLFELYPPADFIRLCDDISQYQTNAPTTGIVSETFGAYSHTFATGAHGPLSWQEAFSDRLRPYRRMYSEVCV